MSPAPVPRQDNRVVIVELTSAGQEIAENTPLGGLPLLRRRLGDLAQRAPVRNRRRAGRNHAVDGGPGQPNEFTETHAALCAALSLGRLGLGDYGCAAGGHGIDRAPRLELYHRPGHRAGRHGRHLARLGLYAGDGPHRGAGNPGAGGLPGAAGPGAGLRHAQQALCPHPDLFLCQPGQDADRAVDDPAFQRRGSGARLCQPWAGPAAAGPAHAHRQRGDDVCHRLAAGAAHAWCCCPWPACSSGA